MKQKRRFAAFLVAIALAAGLIAVPAVATEGNTPQTYTENPGENPGGGETVSSQPPVVEPTPAPEPSTPEPPVSSEPSDSSSEQPSTPSEDPSGGSSQEPGESSEDPWGGSSQEPESSYVEEPSQEPTEDPWQPSDTQSEDPNAGAVVDATTPPVNEPETIATPRPSLERPQIYLNTGNQGENNEEEEDSGPNYVTFAQLNLRGNSMAVTLFYSGVGCIALGVIGLVTILVFYIRGRRRYSEADGILEEIHEAEVRQRPEQQMPLPPAQEPQPAPLPVAPQRPARQVPPGAIMPEEVSLYTEEFSLPGREDGQPVQDYAPGYDDEYESEYDQQDYASSQDDYYDDAYYGDEYYDDGDEYEYEETSYTPTQEQYQQPAPPSDQEATRQFNTEEILREALRYTDDDFQ